MQWCLKFARRTPVALFLVTAVVYRSSNTGSCFRITSAAPHLVTESFVMVDPVWMLPLPVPCVWESFIRTYQVLVGM